MKQIAEKNTKKKKKSEEQKILNKLSPWSVHKNSYLLSSVTHSLWVLRLLQEGRELQHSQLGAGNTSTLPRGGTRRH